MPAPTRFAAASQLLMSWPILSLSQPNTSSMVLAICELTVRMPSISA